MKIKIKSFFSVLVNKSLNNLNGYKFIIRSMILSLNNQNVYHSLGIMEKIKSKENRKVQNTASI